MGTLGCGTTSIVDLGGLLASSGVVVVKVKVRTVPCLVWPTYIETSLLGRSSVNVEAFQMIYLFIYVVSTLPFLTWTPGTSHRVSQHK